MATRPPEFAPTRLRLSPARRQWAADGCSSAYRTSSPHWRRPALSRKGPGDVSRVPAKLAAEWRDKLAASGYRDIEYADGSLLGIAAQEPERAPHDLESTQEYYSRAAEFLHAKDWRGEGKARRAWAAHVEGVPLREISKTQGMPLTTLHRLVERLRRECALWWQETAETRANPPPERGRPRKETPRREAIIVRLTREERIAIRAAAQRAGAERSHALTGWVRVTLLRAAQSVPFTMRKTG